MTQHVPIGRIAARILCGGACIAILATSRGAPDPMTNGPQPISDTLAAVPLPCARADRVAGEAAPQCGSARVHSHHADRLGIHPIGLSGDGQPHDQADRSQAFRTVHIR
jgi:hypothetical protein